jgi:hypothetical protein
MNTSPQAQGLRDQIWARPSLDRKVLSQSTIKVLVPFRPMTLYASHASDQSTCQFGWQQEDRPEGVMPEPVSVEIFQQYFFFLPLKGNLHLFYHLKAIYLNLSPLTLWCWILSFILIHKHKEVGFSR